MGGGIREGRMQDHTFTIIVAGVGIVGTLGGIVIGHTLTRSEQRRQWLMDRRKEQFQELLDKLTQAFLALVVKVQGLKRGGLSKKESDDERERHEKALRVIMNRIYIAEDLRKRGLYDEWTDELKVVWDTGNFTKFEDNYGKMRDWIIEMALKDTRKK
jgi:hypothetical protein